MRLNTIKEISLEVKVGVFATLLIAVIVYGTIKVSDRSIVVGGGYELDVVVDNAIGIKSKTPVEMAGIQIGVVKKMRLDEGGRAHLTLAISKDVRLRKGTRAFVRAKGVLGETFIELVPGTPGEGEIQAGGEIEYGGVVGDVNVLMGQFNEIADDLKAITSSLRKLIGSDESSPLFRSVNNIDKLTSVIKDITTKNEENMNRILANLASITADLKLAIGYSRGDIEKTLENLASITGKVRAGEGTIGKLVSDETTVRKLNDAIDSLNDALGGLKKLETEIGYHTEYLTKSGDFKHYVHLNLRPSPDKAFMFEFLTDPSPTATHVIKDTEITAGGATNTIHTLTSTYEPEKFRFSAQLAKKIYDFTLRGGIIESRGGVGLDYDKGPLSLKFSAFDFSTKYGDKPHLKAWGSLNLTKNFYFVGGADDIINPHQPVDWFVGGGLRLVDEDVKNLIGIGARAVR